MADKHSNEDSAESVKRTRSGILFDSDSAELKQARRILATVVGAVCILFALALASTALLVLIDANARNDGVRFVANLADKVDFGFFDLTNPVKDFDKSVTNPADDAKTALFNYGLAAVAWLLIGRILSRVIRPGA